MDEKIQKLLEEKLDASKVKSRSKGSATLSYIEGWHAIAEANRIFGYDGWERHTVSNIEVCRYEKEGKYDKKNHCVGYEAKVLVRALGIEREGTGHGSGQMPDLFDAIESASKEAETDAMKRALMTFGNPFGLALYDKTRANVSDKTEKYTGPTENPIRDQFPTSVAMKKQYQEVLDAIGRATQLDHVDWVKGQIAKFAKVDTQLSDSLQDALDERLEALNGQY